MKMLLTVTLSKPLIYYHYCSYIEMLRVGLHAFSIHSTWIYNFLLIPNTAHRQCFQLDCNILWMAISNNRYNKQDAKVNVISNSNIALIIKLTGRDNNNNGKLYKTVNKNYILKLK